MAEDEVFYKQQKPKSLFPPAPKGLHRCVCVDVQDLGMQATKFGEKHKIKFVWQIAAKRTDGKPHLLSTWQTLSLHNKSNLRPFLDSWRGKDYTDAQVEAGVEFRAEYVGKAGLMQVNHKLKDNGDFVAVVHTVLPLPEDMEPLKPEPYKRWTKDDSDDDDPVPF